MIASHIGARGFKKKKIANHQLPFDCKEKFSFQNVQLCNGYAAHLGVQTVSAKDVTEALARDGDRSDHESMTGER